MSLGLPTTTTTPQELEILHTLTYFSFLGTKIGDVRVSSLTFFAKANWALPRRGHACPPPNRVIRLGEGMYA